MGNRGWKIRRIRVINFWADYKSILCCYLRTRNFLYLSRWRSLHCGNLPIAVSYCSKIRNLHVIQRDVRTSGYTQRASVCCSSIKTSLISYKINPPSTFTCLTFPWFTMFYAHNIGIDMILSIYFLYYICRASRGINEARCVRDRQFRAAWIKEKSPELANVYAVIVIH